MKVSYTWSGTKGIPTLLIAAVQLATNYPDLPDFAKSTQPPTSPVYPNGRLSAAQLGIGKNKPRLLKQDWAAVWEFNGGIAENIRDALDNKYFEDIEHGVYGYDKVLPRAYITHLEDEYYPLDNRQ